MRKYGTFLFLYSKLESEQNKGSWLIGEQKLKKLDFILRFVFWHQAIKYQEIEEVEFLSGLDICLGIIKILILE